MPNRKHLFDIALLVVILTISAFIYFQVDRMIGIFKEHLLSSSNRSPTEESLTKSILTEIEKPENESSPPPTAPDFQLNNLSGEAVSLSDFLGKAVMVNFWAIWCPPCRAELPLIQEHADQHSDQLVVLAVNAGEEKLNVTHFVDSFGYDLVFLLDPEESAANLYQIRGLPTTIFVDEGGTWQATHIGELNQQLLSNYLEKMGVTE